MEYLLELTEDRFWEQINNQNCSQHLKDIFHGIVHSFLHHCIPPALTDRDFAELLTNETRQVQIVFNESKECKTFSIMIFRPDDPKKYRQFAYLAQPYLHGTSIPL